MSTEPSPSGSEVLKRAEELDALDSILPFDRRDQLAGLLTDEVLAGDWADGFYGAITLKVSAMSGPH